MTIRKLEDLEAWQEARKLCAGVYILTNNYPKTEKYNLIKHLRESSRGVPANIAEGFGRYFFKENLRFYGISKGCLYEIKNDIYLSFDVRLINKEILKRFINQIDKVEAKINGLIRNSLNKMKNNKQT